MKYKSTQIMKQIYLILTGIFLMLFISCARHTKENKDCQTVKIDTVIAADKQKFLQFPGRVKAAQDISLSFRVSGTITRLYAPFSGYVQKRLFEAHETIGAGMPVISMVSAGAPEVEINLPAAEYIRRNRFNRYHCTFDIYPGETYPLQLISVTPKANANQLYTMRLQLIPGKQAVPSPGMNAMVTIFCDTDRSGTLSVPTSAILQKDGKSYVFIYNASDHTVHNCEVSVLRLTNDGYSLISSDGLQPGDKIVSSGVHHIENGETVRTLPEITHTNIGGLL